MSTVGGMVGELRSCKPHGAAKEQKARPAFTGFCEARANSPHAAGARLFWGQRVRLPHTSRGGRAVCWHLCPAPTSGLLPLLTVPSAQFQNKPQTACRFCKQCSVSL